MRRSGREDLWEVRVSCPRGWAEAVADQVAEVWEVSPVVEYRPGAGRARVVAYLEERPDAREWRERCARLRSAMRELGLGGSGGPRLVVRGRRLAREDWAESWKLHFGVLQVGPLVIRPSWCRAVLEEGQVEVVLDPGLSFGTGHHPTTRYCLEELARLRVPERRQGLLDAGTGSGILAVAAAKLGYGPVDALDYDAVAVERARENAQSNGVGDVVRVRRVDLLQLPVGGRRYEVICANVTAPVLLAAGERLCGRLGSGGYLVVAGILVREFDRVRSAFEGLGLVLVRSRREGRWRSGTLYRPGEGRGGFGSGG